MRTARPVVVASLVLSTLVLSCATAFSKMSYSEFAKYGASEWVQFAFVYSIVFIIFAWPWLRAFAVANANGQQSRVVAFSVIAVVLCGLFYQPILTAPTEGIGYYLVICLFLIWLAYPLTRFFAGSSQ